MGKRPQKTSLLNQPDPSYHGAVWTEATKPLGPIAYIIRARVVMLRDLGPCLTPFNAFQIIQGLETVALRMRQHCDNAEKVAEFLSRHNKVSKVIYAGLDDGEAGRRAKKYLNGGFGALIGVELKGGKQAGQKFIESLNMLYHVANIETQEVLLFIQQQQLTHNYLMRI